MADNLDERPLDTTDDDLDTDRDDALETDRPGGWAGVPESLDETVNRPAGPDYGASPLEDETPGSQGDVDPGSEGDFGRKDEPRT